VVGSTGTAVVVVVGGAVVVVVVGGEVVVVDSTAADTVGVVVEMVASDATSLDPRPEQAVRPRATTRRPPTRPRRDPDIA